MMLAHGCCIAAWKLAKESNMSEEQSAILEREERIAACFQAVIDMQNESEEVRKRADIDGVLDFLADEYNEARHRSCGHAMYA
jgi:hypothetical protein